MTKRLSILTILLGCTLALPAHAATARILLVGDSYAEYLYDNLSFPTVLADEGLDYAGVEGAATAIGGLTAAQFASNEIIDGFDIGLLDLISFTLLSYPSIDIVHLSLGANDIIWEGWDWDETPENQQDVLDAVREDVQTTVNHILSIRRNINVVISTYDYFNFVETVDSASDYYNADADDLWQLWGEPTTEEINAVFTALGEEQLVIAQATERCEFVQNWGLMQYHFGYSPNVAAGSTAFPGTAETDYTPYPGGDPALPSPPEAMADVDGGKDALHLDADACRIMAWNCVEQYYADWIVNPSWTFATVPSPLHGLDDAPTDSVLSWTEGVGAEAHNLYFGTSADKLEFIASLTQTTYDPGILEPGTAYYWRVDEVTGDDTEEGDVWTFTTATEEDTTGAGCFASTESSRSGTSLAGTGAPMALLILLLAVATVIQGRRRQLSPVPVRKREADRPQR